MEHAFDQIIDIRRMRDDSAAHFIAGQQIDILVNLNGYFGLPRNGVFAHKPAPIQVNYLGFPATIGAPYIDYLIADKRVLPESDAPFFDEKIVYLPDCYQANDDKRAIGIVPTRESCGLPEDAVVFASFNNSYKYTPALFDVWMRILNKVPGSVLWLLESNRGMAANLRREAQSRGEIGRAHV